VVSIHVYCGLSPLCSRTMSLMMRTAKLSAGVTVVAVSTACAQYVYFETTYQPLVTPKGATGGVERAATPNPGARPLTLGQRAKETGASLTRRVSAWRKPWAPASSCGCAEEATIAAPPPSPAFATTPRVVRRILFVGDSLIAGVGCSHGEAVLPRHVARIIADDLGAPSNTCATTSLQREGLSLVYVKLVGGGGAGVDVQWQAWASVGGDVRELQEQVEIGRTRARGGGALAPFPPMIVTVLNIRERPALSLHTYTH
jgi:hypothetical protein